MESIFYLQFLINDFNYMNDGTLFMQITKFVDNKLNNLEEETLDELIFYYGGVFNLIDYYLNQYETNFIITTHTEKKKMKINYFFSFWWLTIIYIQFSLLQLFRLYTNMKF